MAKKTRILVAKVGCDIHERGALTMLNVFRDKGIEAIYTGRYQSEESVANAAVVEDVDIVSVSDLSGSLVIICRKIINELKRLGADDIDVICGGIITAEDREELVALGVKGCFETGSPVEKTLALIDELMAAKNK